MSAAPETGATNADATVARLRTRLAGLYGAERGAELAARLAAGAARFRAALPASRHLPQAPVLITYGDQIASPGRPALAALGDWLERNVGDAIGAVHVLPFCPYSSDDGFSVIDYRAIDPELGTWDDVAALAGCYTLMADLVLNHVSAESAWFQGFFAGEAPYRDWFIVVDAGTDLSGVTRPRTTPLTHRFETAEGPRDVWTTFSADQIDLNFANPDVLAEIADVLLFYVANGARLIRLDAVTYVWKRLGSTCADLAETRNVVAALRDVLDLAAPGVLIVTETNVPHETNISYFGDGAHEAQMVYQFALPPLLLDAVYRGDATRLAAWAQTLAPPSDDCCFFNMTATHDGIGVRGAQGWMTPEEVAGLAGAVRARGGLVSSRRTEDGGETPYELNITFFDALLPPGADPADPESIERYLTAQAVALSLAGVPGVYVHNLFGTRSHHEGLAGKDTTLTEFMRLVNRRKFSAAELDALLTDATARETVIFRRYLDLLLAWRAEPAFAPTTAQRVLNLDPAVLAIERDGTLLCLHNLGDADRTLTLPDEHRDLLTGAVHAGGDFTLPARRMAWLKRT